MRRYPELKDSGVKWIGMIPGHWKCKKIDSLFCERRRKVSDKDYMPLSVARIGIVPQLENAAKTDAGDNRKLVLRGDFVINSRSDRKGSCGLSQFDGSVSVISIVMTPRSQITGNYVHYLLRSHIFSEEFYRNGRGIVADLWTTRYSEMKSIYLPLPPLSEQEQIARFLDWKTSDIDSLISVRQKQVEKLKELRTSVISSAVTRGLDPSAPMKDSGVKWIGMVPRHWDIQRMTRFFSFRKGLSITKRDLMECGVAVVNYGQIHSKENNGVGLKNDLVKFVDETYLDSCPSALTENGDSIFADTSEDILGCGNSIYVDWNVKIFAGYHTLIAHPGEIGKHRYFAYLFKSEAWRNQVRENVNGVKVYSITQGMLKNTSILLPPLSEQEKIARYLDARTEEIDKLIATYEDEITRLKEFKTSLISDAVTGKIDVRGVRVPESRVQNKEAL